MTWNWQQPEWPNFRWNTTRFGRAEEVFLLEAGALAGMLRHIAPENRERFTIEAMSTEAVTTSEIEGEILDRQSVQSSIRQQLGIAADQRTAGPAEQGIAEVMVDLCRNFAEPLSHTALFKWHEMLMAGRGDLTNPGGYRTHAEPMQVVSGAIYARKVHFEAPPSSRVVEEMARFVDWFQRTAANGETPLPALSRAAIAHLYFVSIHPFEDGNGRISRAIAEKALAQALGRPTLAALAATILVRRKGYYETLEANNKRCDITDWVAWFAATAIEAQRRAIATIDFLIDKTRFLDRLGREINERQRKALLRMLDEGPEGFEGGMNAGKYASITRASPATTTRDLAELVEKGALVRAGERRHTRYNLAIPIRPVTAVTLDENGNLGPAP